MVSAGQLDSRRREEHYEVLLRVPNGMVEGYCEPLGTCRKAFNARCRMSSLDPKCLHMDGHVSRPDDRILEMAETTQM